MTKPNDMLLRRKFRSCLHEGTTKIFQNITLDEKGKEKKKRKSNPRAVSEHDFQAVLALFTHFFFSTSKNSLVKKTKQNKTKTKTKTN